MIESEGISLDKIIDNFTENNVKFVNNICTNVDDAEETIDISNTYEGVYCSIGHHPEEVNKKTIVIEDLLKHVNGKKIIGIGESGLDYHYKDDIFDKNKQKKSFEIHIEVARQSKLPLVVHSRDADADMIEILTAEMKNGEFGFVLHCFCSGEELAFRGLDLGGYVSFSGIVTFKNALEVQNIAKKIPLNRIMMETDAPFLAPVPFRSKVNQPSYIKNTAEFLGNLLNIEFEKIQDITTRNFFNLFKKIDYK
jgi:TatD DNase family protein